MLKVFSFVTFVTTLSKVDGHGMLVLPMMWTDFTANGDAPYPASYPKGGLSASWENGCGNLDYPCKSFKASDVCPADMGNCGKCPLGPKCKKLKQWMKNPNCNYKVITSFVRTCNIKK